MKKCITTVTLAALVVAAAVAAEGFTATVDFTASLLKVRTDKTDAGTGDPVVDSLADGDFTDSEITLGYEGENYGAKMVLGFAENDPATLAPEIALEWDEIYAWIQPLPRLKFTAGLFDNKEGINFQDSDIDDCEMGVFFLTSDGENNHLVDPTAENGTNSVYLSNGLLTGLTLGPVTMQLLLGVNVDPRTYYPGLTKDDPRFISTYGIRGILPTPGVGTFVAQYKLDQAPDSFDGTTIETLSLHTFGFYGDLTPAENLAVTVGYTGFSPVRSLSSVDNDLWSGIDLRAVFTGFDRLSLSTHNNISFAKGSTNGWYLGSGISFLNLYDVVGGTYGVSDHLSLIANLGNLYTRLEAKDQSGAYRNDFWCLVKGKYAVNENASFYAGLKLNLLTSGFLGTDGSPVASSKVTVTTFSIPVGITVSW
jgi:hypothetical protein